MQFKKAVIIGMGLIGGSIGKALLKKGLAGEVIGVCRRRSSLERAGKEKAMTRGYVENYEEALDGADIVFIATPVYTIKDVLSRLADILKGRDVLVTDAGSTKKEIVEFASRFGDNFSFVGSHPLAGSEKAGVEYSDAGLFEDSVCVITPDADTGEKAAERIRLLWEAMGARVVSLTPDEHDKNLAFASHLPHAVAYALVGTLDDDFPKEMLATGFKDTTRLASSDPGLWRDIFMTNRDNLLDAISRFREVLDGIEEDIKSRNGEDLQAKLETYKKGRDDVL